MKLPLENVKVLDMSRMLPGPYCTWLLADMGAEVTRIEQQTEISKSDKAHNTESNDTDKRRRDRAYDFLSRNKKSVLMDLKNPETRNIIYRLAAETDIFVEDYRPGAMERFGIDYEQISKINPAVVYCSISLCGQNGPYRRRPGHDPIVLSLAGVLGQILGNDNAPVMPDPVPIADITAGLHAAVGILLALRVKEQQGRGQHIDISMLDTSFPLLSGAYQRFFRDGITPERRGKQPYLGIWKAGDGGYVCTTNLEPQFWINFCRAIHKEEFIPHQHNRQRKETMIQEIADIMLSKTRDEWVDILTAAESQAAPVYDIREAVKDPQVRERDIIIDIEGSLTEPVRQLGIPIKLSETPGKVRFVAPLPGTHTEEIMHRLGYSETEIQQFTEKGIIGITNQK